MLKITDGFLVQAATTPGSGATLRVDTVPAATVEVSDSDQAASISIGPGRRQLLVSDVVCSESARRALSATREPSEDQEPFSRIKLVSSLDQVEEFVEEVVDAYLPTPPQSELDEDKQHRKQLLTDLVADIMRRIRGELAYWQAYDAEPAPSPA